MSIHRPSVNVLPVRLLDGQFALAPAASGKLPKPRAARMQRARATASVDRVSKPVGHTQVREEYLRLRKLVASLTPEYKVGGLLNGKRFADGVELLWKLSNKPGEWEVIRIYREARTPDDETFDATFHRGDHMIRGTDAVRRFIGYTQIWRADTVDAKTGEYLERQGQSEIYLTPDEWQVLKKWNVAQA